MEKVKFIEKGTIRIHSFGELNTIVDEFKERGLVSPGDAAALLHVNPSYVHQLEKDKRIRVYRLKATELNKKELPIVVRLLIVTPRQEDYIFIPVVDLEDYKEEIKKK
jgi:hypothetical protein